MAPKDKTPEPEVIADEENLEGVRSITDYLTSKTGRKFKIEPDVPVRCACDDFIPSDEFLPHPNNPNSHPPKQIDLLGDIIVGYTDGIGWHDGTGWRAPITVSTRAPHYITKGHGRLLAARKRACKT